MSRTVIQRLIDTEKLPTIKEGRALRIPVSDIDALVERTRIAAGDLADTAYRR
jgi:hypothetical protein